MKNALSVILLTLLLVGASAPAFNAQPALAGDTLLTRADGSAGMPAAPISTADGRAADYRDEYPQTERSFALTQEYDVYRVFPLNIVFVGFDEEVVDTAMIDANIGTDYRFRYGEYDIGYGFDVSYHFADSSYYDALEQFVLANSEADTTSALNATALEIQKETGERMSIFTPQSGRAIDATAVEDWLAANPFRADLEPAYWFYVIDFTELEPEEPGSKHWYTVTEMDFEADRMRDFWRLEWDNPLNPDVGFPYACFTSQSRVFFIDPSAHQWYLEWAKTWWGLPVSGPKYEYYESDLAAFLDEHDVQTPAGRTALAYYLAGWIDDGVVNLLAPALYTGVDVFTAESVSVQTLVLNNALDCGYDNETMSWIADPELYESAIADLAPWMDVEFAFEFVNLEDYPQLQAIFGDAVMEERNGGTYYDGLEVWFGLLDVRESYFDLTAADLVINGYVYLEKDMSMWVYGGEYTGLGGSRQTLVMQEVGRYFEEDGVTPKSGLGKTLVHEVGHNFGFPHTFTETAYAADFAFDVMGYYPNSYFFTQYRKDTFRRLVVDFRLLAAQERLEEIAAAYELREPAALIDEKFEDVYLEIGEVDRLYEGLRFLDAYDKVAEVEDSLSDLEYLVSEYFPEEPEDPDEPSPRCFIATAAYGTPVAGDIRVLRDFRDGYLLTNRPGRAFVDFYYDISPPIAGFITEHPALRPAVRAALLPAVTVSAVLVHGAQAENATIAVMLGLLSAALAIWSTMRPGRGAHASNRPLS